MELQIPILFWLLLLLLFWKFKLYFFLVKILMHLLTILFDYIIIYISITIELITKVRKDKKIYIFPTQFTCTNWTQSTKEKNSFETNFFHFFFWKVDGKDFTISNSIQFQLFILLLKKKFHINDMIMIAGFYLHTHTYTCVNHITELFSLVLKIPNWCVYFCVFLTTTSNSFVSFLFSI